MSNNTESSPKLARGGAQEQIESFLQTAMRGLKEKPDQNEAAEQPNKRGHPVIRPAREFVDGGFSRRSARSEDRSEPSGGCSQQVAGGICHVMIERIKQFTSVLNKKDGNRWLDCLSGRASS
jgi:hypothetical protein